MQKTRIGHSIDVCIAEEKSPVFEEILMAKGAAVGTTKDIDPFILGAFFPEEVSLDDIRDAFMQACSIAEVPMPELKITEVFDEDWQEKMKREFPPLEIGSFFIHSFEEDVPEGMIELRVPSGSMAFGTGEHPTTAGCLALYEQLASDRMFVNGLDMGCGSAVLSMAAAKADGIPMMAVDIDDNSVKIAEENCANNGVENLVICLQSEGVNTDVRYKSPFDLVFANILANPLKDMAKSLVSVMADGGVAILSGFYTEQRDDVISVYEKLGLHPIAEAEIDGWSTVAIVKP